MRLNGLFLIGSFAVFLMPTPTLHAQSPEAIKEKLYEHLGAREGQGAMVMLHKNNLWMHGQEASDARITNTYKDGTISQNVLAKWDIKMRLPDDREHPPTGMPRLKQFNAGDQLYIEEVTVKKDAVELFVYGDSNNYAGYLKFPFPEKGVLPQTETIAATILDVVGPIAKTSDNGNTQNNADIAISSVQGAASSAEPSASTIQVNPVVSVNPNDADLLGIKLGMSSREVANILVQRLHLPNPLPVPTDARTIATTQNCERDPIHPAPCIAKSPGIFAPGKEYVSEISMCPTYQCWLTVTFVEAYPFNSNKREEVARVFYRPEVNEDWNVFLARLKVKYGPPAYEDKMSHARWCSSPWTNDYSNNPCEKTANIDASGMLAGSPMVILSDPSLPIKEKMAWSNAGNAPPL